jgi:hypothetical protein
MLLAVIVAAEIQREMGITKGTNDKEKRAWSRWVEYTKCIGFHEDVWLRQLTPEHRTTIMGAFAAALQRRQFSKPDTTELAAGTVQETIAKLGEVLGQMWGTTPRMSQVLKNYTQHCPDNSRE